MEDVTEEIAQQSACTKKEMRFAKDMKNRVRKLRQLM
jgi:hypothetical protein